MWGCSLYPSIKSSIKTLSSMNSGRLCSIFSPTHTSSACYKRPYGSFPYWHQMRWLVSYSPSLWVLKTSASPYRFPFLIHDLDGSNILKPDSNKGGEVGRFFIRIQDPKAATTYSSPLLYKKIVVLTNALVCTTDLSMFLTISSRTKLQHALCRFLHNSHALRR